MTASMLFVFLVEQVRKSLYLAAFRVFRKGARGALLVRVDERNDILGLTPVMSV